MSKCTTNGVESRTILKEFATTPREETDSKATAAGSIATGQRWVVKPGYNSGLSPAESLDAIATVTSVGWERTSKRAYRDFDGEGCVDGTGAEKRLQIQIKAPEHTPEFQKSRLACFLHSDLSQDGNYSF